MLIGFDVDDRGPLHLLDQIADRFESDNGMLRVLQDAVEDYEQDLFDSSGHGTWAALDPATIAQKGSSRILVDTGQLLDMATGSTRTEGDSVVVELPGYARYLKAGARGAPQRDPSPAPRGSDTEQWARQLLDFAVDGHR